MNPSRDGSLHLFFQNTRIPPKRIARWRNRIYQQTLLHSRCIKTGDFTEIHLDDLAQLFDRYDDYFFSGACRRLLGEYPLEFRLSNRATRSAGLTSVRRQRDLLTRRVAVLGYEIAVSTTLLFQTFAEDHRPIRVGGIRCHDRLEALQRVMEHEIVHLVEMLLYGKSSCKGRRYQDMIFRFFGHTERCHQLITSLERASAKYGIRPGQRVRFVHDGREYVGIVNRITKRATVLVEDPQHGARYSDGKHYSKFYVPLTMLSPADDTQLARRQTR